MATCDGFRHANRSRPGALRCVTRLASPELRGRALLSPRARWEIVAALALAGLELDDVGHAMKNSIIRILTTGLCATTLAACGEDGGPLTGVSASDSTSDNTTTNSTPSSESDPTPGSNSNSESNGT